MAWIPIPNSEYFSKDGKGVYEELCEAMLHFGCKILAKFRDIPMQRCPIVRYQFHPEKSHDQGLKLIDNFIKL